MTSENFVRSCVARYGIECATVGESAKGYRNNSFPLILSSGETLNFIIHKREPAALDTIRRANRVSLHLASHGMPTRVLHDPRIMQLRGSKRVQYAAIYNYLPGKTIPWVAYTQKHIKALGATMGKMHCALRDANDMQLLNAHMICLDQLDEMINYFALDGVRLALNQKLGIQVAQRYTIWREVLERLGSVSEQHPLHLDFVRGNVLFDTSQDGDPYVSGIIDFEKTALGSPLFDIARTLSFLLVDCKYKDPRKIQKYFIASGYRKRGGAGLPAVHQQQGHIRVHALNLLVQYYMFYDFYKFLRHNPYESLHLNEHYYRTERYLRQFGCLVPAT